MYVVGTRVTIKFKIKATAQVWPTVAEGLYVIKTRPSGTVFVMPKYVWSPIATLAAGDNQIVSYIPPTPLTDGSLDINITEVVGGLYTMEIAHKTKDATNGGKYVVIKKFLMNWIQATTSEDNYLEYPIAP